MAIQTLTQTLSLQSVQPSSPTLRQSKSTALAVSDSDRTALMAIPAVNAVLQKYPTPADFMKHYPPALSSRAAANPEKAFFGTAPTIAAITSAYGQKEVGKWLSLLVYDVIAASGASSELKTPADTSRRVAETVAAEFPWLNAAEMLLFTHRLKAGRYGRFYGGFSQIDYCTALRAFLTERGNAYAEHERRTTSERINEGSENAVTRAQYEQIKAAAEKGDPIAIDMLKKPE